MLPFVAMLEDWHGGSGFPFVVREGGGHSLAAYVRSLLSAWRRVRASPGHPTRPAYAAAPVMWASLDRRPHCGERLDEALADETLLAELRAVLREGGAELDPGRATELERDAYVTYIRAYFAKQSRA